MFIKLINKMSRKQEAVEQTPPPPPPAPSKEELLLTEIRRFTERKEVKS